jgi:hypothetical protein
MGEAIAIAANSEAALEELKRKCKWIASSGLVPDHFAKNPQSIAVAIDMARALGEEPIMLMQQIHFVSGKPGFAAQYMLSRLLRSGAIRGTVRYEVTGAGDSLIVRAYVIDAATGKEIQGPPASMEMAKAEGWTKNSKYKSMPEGMLRKRAVTFLVRDHYPNVLAGYLTSDELEDMRHAASTPIAGTVAELNAAIAGELPADTIDVSEPAQSADGGEL